MALLICGTTFGSYTSEYGGSAAVLFASNTRVLLAQAWNTAIETTWPLLNIAPCHSPQSSAHRTMNVPVCLAVVNAMLLTPGLASAFTPSWYAQKLWIT